MNDSPLDVDALVAQAAEATGCDDFGDDTWQEGLGRLVPELRDGARLNELGVHIAAGDVLSYLSARLGVIDYRKHHPEVAEVDVVPPVVIVGQGRTGTTILHELLAQDPANRTPLTWEVDQPCPPPETATFTTDPRIEQVQAALDGSELLIPGFKSMHPMGAELSQECVRITGGDFRSVIFPTQYYVPEYGHWLLYEADMAPTYRWHRIYLQHLQARHPAPRWVLKSPGHIWHLAALLAEYPDAVLVQTHRDPLQIIASLSSLVTLLRRLASDASSIPESAAEWAEYIVVGLDRSVDDRMNGVVADDHVIDVQFADFMADPFVTIRGVYDRMGFELSDEAEAAMRAYLADNPRDKHGRHTYSWSETGLDLGEWRDRVQRYQDYFGVPSEVQG